MKKRTQRLRTWAPGEKAQAHRMSGRVSSQWRMATQVGKFHRYRGLFLLLTAALLLWVIRGFILPLTVGAIFATVLQPLMRLLDRWIKSRFSRAAIVTLAFIVAFLLPIGIIAVLSADAALLKVHELEETGISLNSFSPSGFMRALHLGPMVEAVTDWFPGSEQQIRTFLLKGLTAAGVSLRGLLQSWVTDIPAVLFANVVVVFAMFSFLVEGPRAVQFVKDNSFFAKKPTEQILGSVASVCQSTITATLVTGLAQALVILAACLLTGTSNALLIGLVSFLFSFLPVIGIAPISIGLSLWSVSQGNYQHAFIFIGTIAVVGVVDNLIRPWILKGGAAMHPLVAFVAAFGGLDVMGFYGLFVGPMIAGLFFAVLPVVVASFAD